MSDDDVLFGFRLRLFSLAGEIGVRPACRAMGIHHSTYYRWKRRVDRCRTGVFPESRCSCMGSESRRICLR